MVNLKLKMKNQTKNICKTVIFNGGFALKKKQENLAGSMRLALEVMVVNLAESRIASKNNSTDDLAISGGDLSNQSYSIFS